MRYEVHGFIPGRGFIARFYTAGSTREAIEKFKGEYPKGQAFWAAPAPEFQQPAMEGAWLGGAQLGLHTKKERADALQMARRVYVESIGLLKRDRIRRATENLGYLQAISALAYVEGEEGLGGEIDALLSSLGPLVNDAWKGV